MLERDFFFCGSNGIKERDSPAPFMFNYLDESRKLGLGQTEGDSVQEVRKDGRDQVAAFLDQLANHVSDKQGRRLRLRGIQQLGNKLDNQLQSIFAAGRVAPAYDSSEKLRIKG